MRIYVTILVLFAVAIIGKAEDTEAGSDSNSESGADPVADLVADTTPDAAAAGSAEDTVTATAEEPEPEADTEACRGAHVNYDNCYAVNGTDGCLELHDQLVDACYSEAWKECYALLNEFAAKKCEDLQAGADETCDGLEKSVEEKCKEFVGDQSK